MAMCLFIFFGCFMGKYILWIFAVFHFDKEHICLIVGIQFNEFIFIIHALAGFNSIIKQFLKQSGYRNILKCLLKLWLQYDMKATANPCLFCLFFFYLQNSI